MTPGPAGATRINTAVRYFSTIMHYVSIDMVVGYRQRTRIIVYARLAPVTRCGSAPASAPRPRPRRPHTPRRQRALADPRDTSARTARVRAAAWGLRVRPARGAAPAPPCAPVCPLAVDKCYTAWYFGVQFVGLTLLLKQRCCLASVRNRAYLVAVGCRMGWFGCRQAGAAKRS